jgi:hypothetical protein
VFPFILKTILSLPIMLALGYSDFISLGFAHSAFEASWYHAFNCCSQSLCFPQNSLSILLAITLNFVVLSKVKKSYQIGKFSLSLNVEECLSSISANACGLLLCWHFIIVSRQLKPNKITNNEVNNKCSIEIRLPDIS